LFAMRLRLVTNSLGPAVSFPVIPPRPERTNPASRGGLRFQSKPALDFPLHFRVDNWFFKRMLWKHYHHPLLGQRHAPSTQFTSIV